MMPTFTPLESFWSEEFQSWYCVGLFYTVRNAELAAAADDWKEEGKIKFVERPNGSVQADMASARGALFVGKGS